MSDDPTKTLPEPRYDTQPGITAVLDRINALGENLTQQINNLRTEVVERLALVADQLSTLNAKIDVLNDEMLTLKADQKKHSRRIDELERKVS